MCIFAYVAKTKVITNIDTYYIRIASRGIFYNEFNDRVLFHHCFVVATSRLITGSSMLYTGYRMLDHGLPSRTQPDSPRSGLED